MIDWVRRQTTKAGFILIIGKSYSCGGRNKPLLVLARERSGDYKPPSKKLNREDADSRKCGCLFRLHGYIKT